MTIHFETESEIPAEIKELNPELFAPAEKAKPKRSKYGNKRTMYNGVLYDSQGEAHRAQELDFEMQSGSVLWW